MEFGVARRVPYPPPPRRMSSDYPGASVSAQDGECASALVPTHGKPLPSGVEAPPGACGVPGAQSSVGRSSLVVHQRHMPKEPDKFQIPKKEKKALLKHISSESREYEGVKSILTAGHVDTASAACFTYSGMRLVHSEQLEKEFVEKRREMKAEGRVDKELEESYCFLLTDEAKVPLLCEKGLIVGQNWQSGLGDPNKGVYLCRYSDLIQVHPFHHGASGQIIVFKVMKGKVKSIYENIKNVLDPTPRFDSHLSKNVSKVTSVGSYRAFEYTQHYFYEYDFDELKKRPRQVCPYAVVSFHYKGKDSPLPSMPLAPVRANSWPGAASKESVQFTVWSGDLVHNGKMVSPVSLRSSSLPFLPHKLPDRLKLGRLMRLDEVVQLLPPELFSYNLYGSSNKEVEMRGHHCSLLEVVDRSRSSNNMSRLLQELEDKGVVLVSTLTERGFLFLLSSAQMVTPSERGESWKRRLQALFVFPESRDVHKSPSSCATPCRGPSYGGIAGLKHFIPALHHALVKIHTHPTSELSTGVELHAQEYLVGQKDGKVPTYRMGEYDVKAEEKAAASPAHKRHRLSTDGHMRPYLHNPARYQLAATHASKMVELHCTRLELPGPRKGQEPAGSNTHKLRQLMDLVMTCKRNAENEVKREEVRGEPKSTGGKRRMDQRVAERALKYLKASHEPSEWEKSPVEGRQTAAPPGSLAFAIESVGLAGVAVQEDGSELAGRLRKLLTGLKQAARVAPQRTHSANGSEEGRAESSPFERLAAKMGLPANRDIDLRKQDELEMAGSVSSLEGFSPGGEGYHHDPRGGSGVGKRPHDEDIPWRLIPITGERRWQLRLCHPQAAFVESIESTAALQYIMQQGLRSDKNAWRDQNPPQDPRLHGAMAPLPERAPSPSPISSPGASPPRSPCPEPSPSPEPGPPASPGCCPSPEPPEARRPPSPTGFPSILPSPDRRQASLPREQRSHADDQQQVASPASRECLQADASSEVSSDTSARNNITAERNTDGREDQEPSAQTSAEVKKEATDVVDLTISSEEDECAVVLVSSPPPDLRGIDAILDNHLGHFSTDLHLFLREESINCRFPETPPYRPPEAPSAAPPLVRPFSQYVSPYHLCPPVQGYVSSLQEGFSSMLRDYRDHLASHEPESALASTVSAFVSSIRAGTDEDGMEQTEAARENEAGRPTTPAGQLSDPPPHAAPRPPSVDLHTNHQASPAQSTQSNCVSTSSELPMSGVEPGPDALFLPPAEALSSVIRQLRPEVLSNLCDIIKDVQRSSVMQFYVHAVQPDDQVVRDVKEYLTQQGHTEQDPVSFLKQEVSDGKLLVVIKKEDIAEHLHEIPGLVSLKQHRSVVFLGINTVEDFRTNACEELLAGGGCVLSEDFVLNPDLVTSDQLETLLALLWQRNSPENVWRWKIHSRPFKKLEEQARFRSDAAALLGVVMEHHQRKIVEFLPQHHCDDKQSPPNLHCLIQHQARHTCFRHTIFLKVHSLDFMQFSKSGIIAAGMDEMLHSFDALLGQHNNKPTVAEDPQADRGTARKLSVDDTNGGGTEQQARHPDPSLTDASEQHVLEASLAESETQHSEKDLEMLHMAISQLRAQMHQKPGSDAESGGSPARPAAVPPANEKTAADSTDDRQEEAEAAGSSSSKEADDRVTSSTTACPVEGDAIERRVSDPNWSRKHDRDLRARQSSSHAPSAFSQQQQRWRGGNHYQNHQYQDYQNQHQQHPQHSNLCSDPYRYPTWGFPGQQGAYGGYWDWQQGGGGFNGM
ncbi:protein TASOR isoform X2 [Syngnathus typhle]|uniref:protein TASOR isoform X2 n=1 Tax=Syngnathus typhle TaxID=161592 RepID=UPI002A6B7E56|nr:protein TASOR isoform X2 [Syngnathus typhle]